MIQSSKVLWGEGLFLRPQHFQRQDAYHEWRLAETARALHPYAWGVRRVWVDTDALASGMLRLKSLQMVMRDGEQFNAPQEDELPDAVSLASLPVGVGSVVFHAAMPPIQERGGNFTGTGQPSNGTRYAQHKQPAGDWFTHAAASELDTLQRCVRLLEDSEPRDHLVSMPLLRLRRLGTGAWEIDERFVAPSLAIGAAPALQAMLRRLLDALQAKVDALYGYHREPSRHFIELRSIDSPTFWLLHTASTAFAALSHLHHHAGLHPERLYERLLELAGSLMTFSRRYTLADLRPYSHEMPELPFAHLDELLRELLDTVISTNYFSITLAEVKPGVYNGRLDSQKIGAGTQLYLGVQAAMPPLELAQVVPLRMKVGAPDDVDKASKLAVPGVPMSHVQQTPNAIPVRPGAQYFQLESRDPLYERMLKAQTLALYVPSDFTDLRLELFALNG